MDISAIEKIDLCKNVTVYKGAYSMPSELVASFDTAPVAIERESPYVLLEESNYYNFGRKRMVNPSQISSEAWTLNSLESAPEDSAFSPILELLATYEACLNDFKLRHGAEIDVKERTPLEVRFYEPGKSTGFHSDYEGYLPPKDPLFRDQGDRELNNFSLTMNCYLNSDFEGGELMFRTNSGTVLEAQTVPYQPRAGDIILFASAYPYEHAITRVEKGRRYFTNTGLIENNEPTWQFSLNSGPTDYAYYKDHSTTSHREYINHQRRRAETREN
jgi:hypothetical protein